MPKTYQVKAPSQIHWCRHHPKPHIQKNVSTNDPNRPSERCVHAGKRSKHSGHPNVYDTTRTHGQISTQHVHDLVKCPILNFCMRLFSAAKNKRRPARPSTHLQSTIHGFQFRTFTNWCQLTTFGKPIITKWTNRCGSNISLQPLLNYQLVTQLSQTNSQQWTESYKFTSRYNHAYL